MFFSVVRRLFPIQNNSKYMDPSYRRRIQIWIVLEEKRKEKNHLTAEFHKTDLDTFGQFQRLANTVLLLNKYNKEDNQSKAFCHRDKLQHDSPWVNGFRSNDRKKIEWGSNLNRFLKRQLY